MNKTNYDLEKSLEIFLDLFSYSIENPEIAEDMKKLCGSRDEIIANLFINKTFTAKNEHLNSQLKKLAKITANVTPAAPSMGCLQDAALLRSHDREINEAIKNLIEGDTLNISRAKRLESARFFAASNRLGDQRNICIFDRINSTA